MFNKVEQIFRRRDEPQQIVATRLLYCLQYPALIQVVCKGFTPAHIFNTICNFMHQVIVSSTDSDLEAFSHNPTHGSFTTLSYQTDVNTNYWVNNPTLTEFCFGMIGRADIEGSKSNVAMNAWLPQARTEGSIGHTFMVCIHTENQNQGDFYPFVLLEISVLNEPPLGHLRYYLTDVPPQPNSPSDNVFNPNEPE
ncbi:uncharacterized protein MELLADRAFT_92704 [Melampsora larici-populina 98AG31]|uniref:Uncharacterized protein n=1 Tax=Melampsora larici-populina (strain 98AG31 / pathotype 3-4-7) TaxID=747676 RepID=F4S2J0_MELLP|nr:uncharacterized protein MELLADRAFT_92704 [Melampsora larici-populina 98AG31]EGG01187.1 hypothetical protein MELLADRAFT_92704 [Melampsora larici-populina 98AG31]